MAGPKFYPALVDVMAIDDLPDALGPIKSGLTTLFSHLYFKNLQYDKSPSGDRGFFSLEIVSLAGLNIPLGGDFQIRFNPSSGNTSATPITLRYDWKLIKVIRSIKDTGFSESAAEFFDAIPRLLDFSETDLLTMAVAVFEAGLPPSAHATGEGIDASHVDSFITKVNLEYSLSGGDAIPSATATAPLVAIEALKNQIYTDPHQAAIGRSAMEVLYDVYLDDPDPNVAKDNIRQLFRSVAEDVLQFVLDLLLPKVEASISIEVGLEFPRTILIPLDGSGEELAPTEKSMILAGPGIFYFSTETGLSHDLDISVGLNHPSKIANTGFTIDFSGIKFDLNENTNIPEADADGRPVTFKGVFIEEVAIGLPKGWVEDGVQAASVKGEKLLIGNEGGISGKIFLDGGPLSTKMGDITLRLDELGVEFFQNEVVEFNAEAAVNIPGLEEANGDPAWITIGLGYENDLYTVTGSGFPLLKLFGFGIEINTLSFTFDNTGIQGFSIAADIYIDGITDAAGDPKAISIEITKAGDILTAGLAAPLPPLKIFGIELIVESLAFSINLSTNELAGFEIGGKVKIEQLKQPNSSNPAEIGITIGYATTPSRLFSLDLDGSGLPPAKLGDFDVALTAFGFDFVDGNFSNFNLTGTVKHPDLLNSGGQPEPLSFTVDYQHTPSILFTLSVGAPASGVSIKGLPFAFTGFSISFSDTTLHAISISGIITITAIKDKNTGNPAQIAVIFAYDNGDISIAGTATGVILVVDGVLEFAPTGIEFGRESGNWFFGMTGSLTRLLDVPVVGKFIPSKVTADEFKIKQGDSPEFDLSFEWEDGVKVSGTDDGGLEFIIPIDKTFFGSLTLGGIGLKLIPGTPDGLETEIRLYNASLALGPFTGTVDGMGLSLDVSFPQNGGNLGPIDIGIGFIPPTGIGFVLDAGAVKGGGFLSFDHDAGRYAGALELDFSGLFGFTAVGIITTKMPDGSNGFTLLLLINVTFGAPIALGFNFYLAGVGGLIGIHRTMDTEAIRLGVKDGSISNILFPENVIANISKIISDMEKIFPIKKDQFFLGLMARITWNTPALLTIDAGLAIEFPSPVRIAILGVIRCALPTKDKAIIKLNVAFAGIIDFEKKLLTFDASIFDSKILTITLEGDMALRVSWGDKPDFLVSVGGFHPSYTPPAHLQLLPMKRMTVNILSGNPNLVLTAYFALTSNTIQFGAAIDFSFKISKFGIYGHFGFDVLIQFSPFRFIAGISASVEVKWGSTVLMSIGLSFNLEGPSPWRAHGYAKFKILFFSFKVKFDKTWGEKKENSLPATDILPLLLEEMNKDENWDAKPGANRPELVTLAQSSSEPGVVIVRPFGSLEFNQSVVPMDLTMERFGNYSPGDIVRATFTQVTVNGIEFDDADFADLKNNFAPSAYKDMSDADKLKAPSYEKQNSGVRLQTTDEIKFDYGINRLVQYETILSDEEEEELGLVSVSAGFFHPFVKGGAIGKSELSQAKKKKLKQSKVAVSMGDEQYGVAFVDNMSNAVTGNATFDSKAQADEYLRATLVANPELEGTLQLTPAYQMV